MKNINKIAKITTKVLEVFHWVAVALMVIATVCSVVAPKWVHYFVGIDAKECCGADLTIYGFELNAPVANGNIDMTYFLLFGIAASILLSVMAMTFRNLHLIFKKSENASPFQKDNIRMLKEIGYFSISIPVIGLIMSLVCHLVLHFALGVEEVETSINMSGIFMGIIVLSLTQFFVHGMKLDEDVDGLL